MSRGDYPAFPYCPEGCQPDSGMTIREVFTAIALTGVANNADISYEDAATHAVSHADEALAELEKSKDDSAPEPS